ncbi:hypothetical protein A2U01_0119038, partial [Trifolium medium]|nr:hypothetical protein [Trifolium medium]
ARRQVPRGNHHKAMRRRKSKSESQSIPLLGDSQEEANPEQPESDTPGR